MNKQLQQQDLKQFMRILNLEITTLINVLNARGFYYQKYRKQFQQRRQSYLIDYLPKKF